MTRRTAHFTAAAWARDMLPRLMAGWRLTSFCDPWLSSPERLRHVARLGRQLDYELVIEQTDIGWLIELRPASESDHE